MLKVTKADREAYQEFKDKQFDKYYDVLKDRENSALLIRHQQSLGATTASVMLDVSPFTSKANLYEKMTCDADALLNYITYPLEAQLRMDAGSVMEEYIALAFSKITHKRIGKETTTTSKKYSWLTAQTDRTIIGENADLECKFSNFDGKDEDSSRLWGQGCIFNSNGEIIVEDDLIPPYYYAQVQQQMLVRGHDYRYLAVAFSNEVNKPRIYLIHKNEEIQNAIVEKGYEFLFCHVMKGVPYPQEETTKTNQIIVREKSIDLTPITSDWVDEYRNITKQIKPLEKRQKELKELIKGEMDKAKAFSLLDQQGKEVAKISSYTRNSFDAKRFADDHADLARDYYVTSEIERFSIK